MIRSLATVYYILRNEVMRAKGDYNPHSYGGDFPVLKAV